MPTPEERLDDGAPAMAPVIRFQGPATTRWEALDAFMWAYHDGHRAHTGPYAYCDACTSVLAFMRDNPDWNRA